jgi:hypothetical protein
MQIDLHFYGIYALARAAGINSIEAEIIAHASQFVDDSIDDNEVVLQSIGKAVIPILTSHKPLNFQISKPAEQWRVWVPFHFLPGNEPSDGTFIERMTCRKNSEPAKKILEFALDKTNTDIRPYIAGIATHVFADTFSHNGFLGLSSEANNVKGNSIKFKVRPVRTLSSLLRRFGRMIRIRIIGFFAKLIPVGHGAVDNFPDLPYLNWSFEFQTHAQVDIRNNQKIFLEAAEQLFIFFKNYQTNKNMTNELNSQKLWEEIQPEIIRLISISTTKENRIKAWKLSIAHGKFSTISALDGIIGYSKNAWLPESLNDIDFSQTSLESCHTIIFYKAATRYREYVYKVLLPQCGLCVG